MCGYFADLLSVSSRQAATKHCEILKQAEGEIMEYGNEPGAAAQLFSAWRPWSVPDWTRKPACRWSCPGQSRRCRLETETFENIRAWLEKKEENPLLIWVAGFWMLPVTLFPSCSMPKSEQRCSTNMSVSTKDSGSNSSSTRSLAVSLPCGTRAQHRHKWPPESFLLGNTRH